MHPLQEMKLNRIDGYLAIDQGTVDYLKKITLETIVANVDVYYARNQYGDMHFGQIAKIVLENGLHHSEKTRHGQLRHFGFLDLLYAFPRCEVLNDNPNGSNTVVVIRDNVTTYVHVKSGPNWGDSDLREKAKEKAAAWLEEFGYHDGEIVFCSENGNGNSWSREPSVFNGHIVRELYGAACMEFFTGHVNPTELIDRQVVEALVKQRKMCPHHLNATLIDRKVMQLQEELLKANNQLFDLKLLDDNGSPIWGNWLQAKEQIGAKIADKKRSHIKVAA